MEEMSDLEISGYDLRSSRPRVGGRAPLNGSLLIGLLAAALVIIGAISLSSQPSRFLNLEGLLIVFGGTIASTLIQYSIADVRGALVALRQAASTNPQSPSERVEYLLELSQRVKQAGILALEDAAERERDDFLRLGLMAIVDGRRIDDLKRILKTEMESSRERAWRSVHVWETMGNFAPAMGLIGTLLGLIQMLGSLHDPSSIGSSMAMALVATLYGSVGANLFFFPIAGKLRVVSQEREECKNITLEGLLSISRLENPIMLAQRLQSFASALVNG
jgi:chemotaxis protein MotA